MQSADDLDAGLDISTGRFQLCEAFVTCGDDFGEVSVETKSSDFLDERGEGGSGSSGAQSPDKCGVLCQFRVERLADGEEIWLECCLSVGGKWSILEDVSGNGEYAPVSPAHARSLRERSSPIIAHGVSGWTVGFVLPFGPSHVFWRDPW